MSAVWSRGDTYSTMKKLARQSWLAQVCSLKDGLRDASRLWLLCISPSPPSSPSKRSHKLGNYWSFTFKQEKGGVGGRRFWQSAKHHAMLWWEGLIQQARTILHLCWALPHHCHTGSVSEGHMEQASAQLYFHRRRRKLDGLKEHYTLDLAGRLVIYNNEFAVKRAQGFNELPLLQRNPFPSPKFVYFSFWLSARILQHLTYNPNWASQLAWWIIILLDNYETKLIGFQRWGKGEGKEASLQHFLFQPNK